MRVVLVFKHAHIFLILLVGQRVGGFVMEYLHGWLVCGKHGRDKVVHLVVQLIVAVLPLMDVPKISRLWVEERLEQGSAYPRLTSRMRLFTYFSSPFSWSFL